MKKKKQLKQLISRIITVICLSAFIYSVYSLSEISLGYMKNRKVLAEVQNVYEQLEKEDPVGNADVRKQFETLHEINQDIVGWIAIGDTKINYPIVQADNNEFYLTRNYKKENSRAGSIFLDYRNDLLEEEKNIILYGHRMKDETMFQQLNKYFDEEFFNENSLIEFDTMYESYDAEIFAVYYTTTDFDYIQTEFQSDNEYEQLLKSIKEKSIYDVEVDVNTDDQILTLSTCDYTLDPKEGRLVVHAKLKVNGGL